MRDVFKDVDADHSIRGEGTNRMDPWEGDASKGMESEECETSEDERKLERYEVMVMEG